LTPLVCTPACWGATDAGELDVVPLPGDAGFEAPAEPPELVGVPPGDDWPDETDVWSEPAEVSLELRLEACGATVVESALWVPSVEGPAI
jgi:hypothetical protein